MTSEQLEGYINVRGRELSADEIVFVTDVHRHPQIDHIVFKDNFWDMWDKDGKHFRFTKRDWK